MTTMSPFIWEIKLPFLAIGRGQENGYFLTSEWNPKEFWQCPSYAESQQTSRWPRLATASGDAVEDPKPFMLVFVVANDVRAIDSSIQDVSGASRNLNAETSR